MIVRSSQSPSAWIYLDVSNNEQGPFDTRQILLWYVDGDLPMDLMLKPSHDSLKEGAVDEYAPLSSLIGPGGLLRRALIDMATELNLYTLVTSPRARRPYLARAAQ